MEVVILKEQNKEKPIITHYLKNGEKRDSMEGYKVPVNEKTKAAYMLLATVKPTV